MNSLISIALFLATLTIEATVLLGGAWLIVRYVRLNAACRHMVWLAAFAALLTIPVLSLVAPAARNLEVPIPAALSEVVPQEPVYATVAVPEGASDQNDVAPPVPLPAPAPPKPSLAAWLLALTMGSWLAGALAIAIQAAIATLGIVRLRRQSRLVLLPDIDHDELASCVGLSRPWELRISTASTPPTAMTWGVLRPVVLLPEESVDWPVVRQEAVLLHELAHVRRLDSLSQILGLAVCAMLWFHPLAWLALESMRACAEQATDDAVIRSGFTPSAYAAELLKISAGLGCSGQPHAAIGVPIMKTRTIEARITSIVDPANRHTGVRPVQIARTCAVAAVLALLMAGIRPTAASPQSASPAVIAPISAQDQNPGTVSAPVAAQGATVAPTPVVSSATPVAPQGATVASPAALPTATVSRQSASGAVQISRPAQVGQSISYQGNVAARPHKMVVYRVVHGKKIKVVRYKPRTRVSLSAAAGVRSVGAGTYSTGSVAINAPAAQNAIATGTTSVSVNAATAADRHGAFAVNTKRATPVSVSATTTTRSQSFQRAVPAAAVAAGQSTGSGAAFTGTVASDGTTSTGSIAVPATGVTATRFAGSTSISLQSGSGTSVAAAPSGSTSTGTVRAGNAVIAEPVAQGAVSTGQSSSTVSPAFPLSTVRVKTSVSFVRATPSSSQASRTAVSMIAPRASISRLNGVTPVPSIRPAVTRTTVRPQIVHMQVHDPVVRIRPRRRTHARSVTHRRRVTRD